VSWEQYALPERRQGVRRPHTSARTARPHKVDRLEHLILTLTAGSRAHNNSERKAPRRARFDPEHFAGVAEGRNLSADRADHDSSVLVARSESSAASRRLSARAHRRLIRFGVNFSPESEWYFGMNILYA
jgi:hypothetical protein